MTMTTTNELAEKLKAAIRGEGEPGNPLEIISVIEAEALIGEVLAANALAAVPAPTEAERVDLAKFGVGHYHPEFGNGWFFSPDAIESLIQAASSHTSRLERVPAVPAPTEAERASVLAVIGKHHLFASEDGSAADNCECGHDLTDGGLLPADALITEVHDAHLADVLARFVPAPKTKDEEAREALAKVIEGAWGDPTWDRKTLRPLDRQIADAILARYNLVPVSPEGGE